MDNPHPEPPREGADTSTSTGAAAAAAAAATASPLATAPPPPPPLHDNLHVGYISNLASKLDRPTSYEGAVTEHLRMSGVYWSLAALSLLRPEEDADALLGVTVTSRPTSTAAATSSRSNDTCSNDNATDDDDDDDDDNGRLDVKESHRKPIVDWVFDCYDPSQGGFGGNVGHDAHLLYTLSALQILAMADRLDDPRLDREAVVKFVASLQQRDGSFAGDEWGEVDTRFSYCALSALSILGALPDTSSDDTRPTSSADDASSTSSSNEKSTIDVQKAALYVSSCRNFDGGFGSVPGAESHAGQIFCCVGALSIARSLHLLDCDLLCWWLAERQCDSGGLNGRPEKQADVCYSWWILSALSILGRTDWINSDRLAAFILRCQDDDDGGIADRPNDMPDVFHTFFGIAGLSLLGVLDTSRLGEERNQINNRKYRDIDPVYALPTDVVARLGLRAQVMPDANGKVHDRLSRYDAHVASRR